MICGREKNTRYYHNLVKGRRNRLKIKRIKDKNDTWIEDEEQMITEAIEWYNNQFSQEGECTNQDMLQQVPYLVTQENNELLSTLPTMEEVKKLF